MEYAWAGESGDDGEDDGDDVDAGDGDGDDDGDENKKNQEDELMDDFVYWDSIGGHVDDQARPPNRQNGVRQEFGNIWVGQIWRHFLQW